MLVYEKMKAELAKFTPEEFTDVETIYFLMRFPTETLAGVMEDEIPGKIAEKLAAAKEPSLIQILGHHQSVTYLHIMLTTMLASTKFLGEINREARFKGQDAKPVFLNFLRILQRLATLKLKLDVENPTIQTAAIKNAGGIAKALGIEKEIAAPKNYKKYVECGMDFAIGDVSSTVMREGKVTEFKDNLDLDVIKTRLGDLPAPMEIEY